MEGWTYAVDDFAKYLLSRLGDYGKVCCRHKSANSKVVIIEPDDMRGSIEATVLEAMSMCPCLIESYDDETGELVFASASRAKAFIRFYRGTVDKEVKDIIREYVGKLYDIYDEKPMYYAMIETPPVMEFYWHGNPNPSILLSMVRKLPEGMARTEFRYSKEDDSGCLKIWFRSRKWVKIFREILEEGRQ